MTVKTYLRVNHTVTYGFLIYNSNDQEMEKARLKSSTMTGA